MKESIRNIIIYIGCLCSLLLITGSCTDDKFDEIVDNRYLTENIKNSNIRIINFDVTNQVIVNGDSVTNFILRYGENDPLNNRYPSTKYFPDGGRLGQLWNFPQDLLDSNNKAHVKLTMVNLFEDQETFETEFDVEDNGTPTDYYHLINEWYAEGLSKVIAIPRSIEAPSKSDHFKVRLINLAETPSGNYSYIEELFGPMSLVYADGTTISDKLNGIDVGKYSEYVEVPYGTYQFKVLTQDGRQVPASGSPQMNRNTSSISNIEGNQEFPSYLTYAPISVFQPGGVYTIVIFAQQFSYPDELDPVGGYSEDLIQNGFKIIEDIDPPVNATYARIQFVNALPQDGALTFRLNGKDVAQGIAFGNHTGYASVVKGTYNLEIVDDKGETIASTNYDISAGDNYSAWLYESPEGKPSLIVVFNDLTGSLFNSNNIDADASLNRYKNSYFTKFRFLNLNPDIPYATFTTDNGNPFTSLFNNGLYSDEAAWQLQPGYIYPSYPYIWNIVGTFSYKNYSILTYRASENITPGIWADDIIPLQSKDFVTRPELYDIRDGVPTRDVGIYTVALIGKTTDNEKYASKMMFVKHTK